MFSRHSRAPETLGGSPETQVGACPEATGPSVSYRPLGHLQPGVEFVLASSDGLIVRTLLPGVSFLSHGPFPGAAFLGAGTWAGFGCHVSTLGALQVPRKIIRLGRGGGGAKGLD